MQTPPHPAELISRDKEYRTICRKLTENHPLQDDLYSEAVLIICELPDEKQEHFVRNPQELRWYFYVVCRNLWYQKSGDFYKNYRRGARYIEIDDDTDHIYESDTIEGFDIVTLKSFIKLDKREHDKKGKYPFDATVLEYYMQYGSTRKMSRLTTIPHTTFHLSLKRSRARIKELIKNGKL